MQVILTVSQLVEAVNMVLSELEDVTVEGEVAEYKVIHNKWVTFQLKDERATVGCFMPVWDLKTQLEDGMLIRAVGRPRLREKGFFSFVLTAVTPAGEGALKRAFELLKKKLEVEGLFAPERKRALPTFPRHVALITSRDAAAYSDFVKVLQGRIGGLTISFLHTQVQGEDAPRQLVTALTRANTELQQVDVIVMVRGGGSLEDLQAFNDEGVVRAVAASRTPTVVGVGHERDSTLAELAADLRASTPSNAAELLVRSRQEILARLERWQTTLRHRIEQQIMEARHRVQHGMAVLKARVASTLQRVQQLVRMLHSLSPEETLKRGYSITRTSGGRVVKHARDVSTGDTIRTTLWKGEITSTV